MDTLSSGLAGYLPGLADRLSCWGSSPQWTGRWHADRTNLRLGHGVAVSRLLATREQPRGLSHSSAHSQHLLRRSNLGRTGCGRVSVVLLVRRRSEWSVGDVGRPRRNRTANRGRAVRLETGRGFARGIQSLVGHHDWMPGATGGCEEDRLMGHSAPDERRWNAHTSGWIACWCCAHSDPLTRVGRSDGQSLAAEAIIFMHLVACHGDLSECSLPVLERLM